MVQHFANPSAQVHLEIKLEEMLRLRLAHKGDCRFKAKVSFVQVHTNDHNFHKNMANSLQHDVLIKLVMLVGDKFHALVRSCPWPAMAKSHHIIICHCNVPKKSNDKKVKLTHEIKTGLMVDGESSQIDLRVINAMSDVQCPMSMSMSKNNYNYKSQST